MFSRIQSRPAAFTGPIHNFGDQSSPQNLVGATDLSRKDEFRHDFNKIVQNTTQPANIEQAPSLPRKREKPHVDSPAMSYTGGWANPMNPNLGGAPLPHADMGLESPSFQNRRVSETQGQQLHFRGIDHQQGKPAFTAFIADYPSIERVALPRANSQQSKTAAKSKSHAKRAHHTSPFSMSLPYDKL